MNREDIISSYIEQVFREEQETKKTVPPTGLAAKPISNLTKREEPVEEEKASSTISNVLNSFKDYLQDRYREPRVSRSVRRENAAREAVFEGATVLDISLANPDGAVDDLINIPTSVTKPKVIIDVPRLESQIMETMSTSIPDDPPDINTDDADGGAAPPDGKGLMSPLTDDDMGLPDNRSDEEKIIALEPMFKFISKGEGGYNASNRGTIKGKGIQGSTNNTTRDGKKLTEMTIAEIKAKQSITDPNNKDRLFAVGRFQTIPNTLDMAINALNLSDDTVFNEATQDKIGRYLITQKREEVGKYLSGDTSISTDAAMQLLAQEFASFPVPKDQTIKRGGKTVELKKGDSYYGSGNKAQHTFKEVKEELDKLRGKV